uniref:Lipid-binding serum glycoprotein C-terminal domain-containing protein n=1 Tax=Panagrolaimus sp. PS1159 TaxID=55785 RepID=A0AC35G3C3_9BILA
HVTNPYSKRHVIVSSGPTYNNYPISNTHFINSASSGRVANRFTRDTRPHAHLPPSHVVARGASTAQGFAPGGQSSGGSSSGSGGGIQIIQPGEPSPCGGGCPGTATQDPLSQIQEITKYLDISKLNDIFLTVQLMQTYATTNDYSIDLNGEFSQGGQGGTPFGACPTQFPNPFGTKMAEAIISDYTLNSLFYSLHRKGFLSVRLGPETPKIGPLLKTSCSDDDDTGLEDHGVETDEATRRRRLRKVRSALLNPTKPKAKGIRTARQDGGLGDLGICLGDILPVARDRYPNRNINILIHTSRAPSVILSARNGDILPVARDRYPNRNINILIHTSRAPSVILSARNGGIALIDLSADADIFTDSNEKIGTIRVEGSFEVQIQTSGNRLTGNGQITNLRLTNPDQSLGLSQEALDNLGNLGKELVGKAANDVLQRGIPLNIPTGAGGLPLNFVQPDFRIVEHGIYLSSDFTISPSFISQLTGGGGGGGGGGVCRR